MKTLGRFGIMKKDSNGSDQHDEMFKKVIS
jgi:hypothetical protein